MELVENAVVAGRFRLHRMLGRGGMGSVWLATALDLDIQCAVKFIEGEFATLPEAQARFEREAKAAAKLQNPHVVSILAHGVSEGRPYIAMELLEGEDLGKRLQRVGTMDPNELVRIITQVCRALTRAHALGIVHRDLKPDNIFLVKDDDREIAKVLDFGIAKFGPNGNAISGSATKTGAMLGTPYYMSPEQAQGNKSVDYRSDLWSLAVICFQALTGQLPFESEALGDLLVKIIVPSPNDPVPSKYGLVPLQFDAWWKKAANRDPAQRFQSAKEFADALSMAIGVSGVTDVMDARALHAAIARGGDGRMPSTGTAMMGNAPVAQGSSPRPFGHTPQSAMAQSVAQPDAMRTNPDGSGGAPVPRTFSGVEHQVPPPPKKSNAVLFAALGVAFMMVLVGVGGGVMIMKSRSAASGAPTAEATATAAPTTPATATAAPPPTETAVATAAPTASAAPTAAPTATTPTPPATTAAVAANPPAGTAKTTSHHGDTKPPPATTTKTTTTQTKTATETFGF